MQKIPLTQGHFALIDDDDYLIVSQYKWTYDHGYAVRKVTLAPKHYQEDPLIKSRSQKGA